MMQIALITAVSLLVGLASAGLIWFGADLGIKLRHGFAQWRHARALEKAEEAKDGKDAAEDEDP